MENPNLVHQNLAPNLGSACFWDARIRWGVILRANRQTLHKAPNTWTNISPNRQKPTTISFIIHKHSTYNKLRHPARETFKS